MRSAGFLNFNPLLRRISLQLQGMYLVAHQLAQGRVNGLMLAYAQLALKFAADDDTAEVHAIIAFNGDEFTWHTLCNESFDFCCLKHVLPRISSTN